VHFIFLYDVVVQNMDRTVCLLIHRSIFFLWQNDLEVRFKHGTGLLEAGTRFCWTHQSNSVSYVWGVLNYLRLWSDCLMYISSSYSTGGVSVWAVVGAQQRPQRCAFRQWIGVYQVKIHYYCVLCLSGVILSTWLVAVAVVFFSHSVN